MSEFFSEERGNVREIDKKRREEQEQERWGDWDCKWNKMKYGFHSGSIYLCVCIGLNFAFASIQFFVGLAWGVCVLHCSAWMWLCFHWIIWALLSLYQLFALSETDPQMCVHLDLHAMLVNMEMLFVVTYCHHHRQLQTTQKESCICNVYNSCVLLNGNTVLVCGCLLLCDAREQILLKRLQTSLSVCHGGVLSSLGIFLGLGSYGRYFFKTQINTVCGTPWDR